MSGFVYALFDFRAGEDDEISFRAGERIDVLDKDDEFSDGWWRGRNRAGDIGIFPVNHTSPYKADIPAGVRPATSMRKHGHTGWQAHAHARARSAERLPRPKLQRENTPARMSLPGAGTGGAVGRRSPGVGNGTDSGKPLPLPLPTPPLVFPHPHPYPHPFLPTASSSSGPGAFTPLSPSTPKSPSSMTLGSLPLSPGTPNTAGTGGTFPSDFMTSPMSASTSQSSMNLPQPQPQPFPQPPGMLSGVPTPPGLSPALPLTPPPFAGSGHHLSLPPLPLPLDTTCHPAPSREEREQELINHPGVPSSWTTDYVVAWLSRRGFDSAIEAAFLVHDISGDVLLSLDLRVMKEELGIAAYGKRVRLGKAIAELRRMEQDAEDRREEDRVGELREEARERELGRDRERDRERDRGRGEETTPVAAGQEPPPYTLG